MASVAFAGTEIFKWDIINFLLYSKINFSEQNGWSNFSNSSSLVSEFKVTEIFWNAKASSGFFYLLLLGKFGYEIRIACLGWNVAFIVLGLC